MGAGLVLFMVLLCLVLVVYVGISINNASAIRKKSDKLYSYSLQIYVDMHKMKKQNRTISVDDSYVGLLSGQSQTLITLILKLSSKAKYQHSSALCKDWHVKRICVAGVDVASVSGEKGKALLKASLDFLKFRDFRVEWNQSQHESWNVKGFNDSDKLSSFDIVNMYLSEAKSAQIFVSNTGRSLTESDVPTASYPYTAYQPKEAKVERAKEVVRQLSSSSELLGNLIGALQEHIQQREEMIEVTPDEDENIEIIQPNNIPEPIVTEEITHPCALPEVSEIKEPEEAVTEVTPEKKGNIDINKLYSSSELVVSIPDISVFEAIQMMDERKKKGYYTNLEDMKDRLDIDPMRLDQFAEYIHFSLPEEAGEVKKSVFDF